ncbi:hypothetical protein SprV_0401417200 [Sparganum proliferum]
MTKRHYLQTALLTFSRRLKGGYKRQAKKYPVHDIYAQTLAHRPQCMRRFINQTRSNNLSLLLPPSHPTAFQPEFTHYLLDNPRTNRPKRRTTLVPQELTCHKVDITALSEIPFPNQSQLENVGAAQHLLLHLPPTDRASLRRPRLCHPHRHPRTPVLSAAGHQPPADGPAPGIQIRHHHHSTYASPLSTMTASDEVNTKSCKLLHAHLASIAKANEQLVLGDFIHPVGTDYTLLEEGALGPHRIGVFNNNALLHPQTCSEHCLVLTNTPFHLAMPKKDTFMHPQLRNRHPLHYLLVQRRDRPNVLVICNTDCFTDHCLPTINTMLRLQSSRTPQNKRTPEMLNADLTHKAEEDQAYADRNETKNFFVAIETIYDERNRAAYHLSWINASNRQITHSEVLGPTLQQSTIPPSTDPHPIANQAPLGSLALPPSLSETIRPLQQLSSAKTPGSDVSPNGIYRHDGHPLTPHFQQMWRRCAHHSQHFNYATISHTSACGNGTANSLTITEECPCSAPPGRSSLASSSSLSIVIMNKHFRPKVSAHRADTAKPPTSSLPLANYKKEVSADANSPLHHLDGPDESL